MHTFILTIACKVAALCPLPAPVHMEVNVASNAACMRTVHETIKAYGLSPVNFNVSCKAKK
jgi:hypothetical protein